MKRPFLDYFDYFVGTYVLVSTIVARLSASSIVSALLVAQNLFLIPYLTGSSISNFFIKELNNKRVSFRFSIGFFVGTVFLHASFVLAEFFGYKIEMSVFNLIIILIIIVGFVKDMAHRLGRIKGVVTNGGKALKVPKVDAGLLFGLFVPFLIAVLAFYVPKILVPFPMVSLDGGVGHEILKPVNRLLNDGLLDVYRTRALPVVLEAIVCSLSSVPILNLNWAAPLGTCLVFAFSMFSLSYSVSKHRIVALSSALLAFFINNAGLSFDVTLYIFRYSTIIAAIFPLVIQEAYLHLIKAKKEILTTKKHIVLLFIGTLTAIATLWTFEFLRPDFLLSFFKVNEFLRPFIYIGFLVFSFVYIRRLQNQALKSLLFILAFLTPFAISLDIFRPIISVLFLYFFIFLIDQIDSQNVLFSIKIFGITNSRFSPFGRTKFSVPRSIKINILRLISILMVLFLLAQITGYLKMEEFAPFYKEQASTSSKVQSLITSNSIGILVLSLFLGIFLLFTSRVEDFVFAFSFIVGMFAYFLPLFEVYYIAHEFLNVFMAFTLSIGAFRVIHVINKHAHVLTSKISKIRANSPVKFSDIAYLLLIFVIFVPVVSASINRFTYAPEGATHASLLTDYELESIKNYLSKTNEDIRIISDPFTMIYLSSYINHVALIGDPMPPFSEQSESILIKVRRDIFNGNSSLEMYSNITSFNGIIPFSEKLYLQRIQRPLNLSKYIIVVSVRTAWWLDHEDPYGYYPLFPQTYNVTSSHIARFFDPRFFTPVYKIDNKMYMFLVEKKDITLSPISENNVLSLSFNGLNNSKITDESEYENNVTIHGAALVNGTVGKGLSFDGLDDYLEVPDSPSLNITPPFTVELNIHPILNKPWASMYKGDWSTDNSWHLYGEDTNKLIIRYWYNGTSLGAEYSYDFLNKWTHVAVVYQETGKPILLYINGILVASGSSMPSGVSYNTQKLWIGRFETSDYYVQGFIDEIRIYNRALTPEEIYNNYLYVLES